MNRHRQPKTQNTSTMKDPPGKLKGKFKALKSKLRCLRRKKHGTTSSTDTFDTFHPFPRLPPELRMKIWEYHIDRTPRIFELGQEMIENSQTGQLTLFKESCPRIRIPFPANINQELRHEMMRRYQRIEFSNGIIVWINLKIDTIFISHLTDIRFLINFNKFAQLYPWLTEIQNLAVSVERFFELEYFSWGKRDESRKAVAWAPRGLVAFCLSEISPEFMSHIGANTGLREFLNLGRILPGQDFQDSTSSWRQLLLTTPLITNLKLVHHSKYFRTSDTGVLSGPLSFDVDHFSGKNRHYQLAKRFHKYTVRAQRVSECAIQWKTFDLSESLTHVDRMQFSHITLLRNGVPEVQINQLTRPFQNQCTNRLHSAFAGVCPHRWTSITLPVGIQPWAKNIWGYDLVGDHYGPHLKDSSGKRIPYYFDDREGVRKWKLGIAPEGMRSNFPRRRR